MQVPLSWQNGLSWQNAEWAQQVQAGTMEAEWAQQAQAGKPGPTTWTHNLVAQLAQAGS